MLIKLYSGLATFLKRMFLQLQVVVNDNSEVSITDFEFVGGILFPDIISLNFTLSVDPEKERPVGSGDAQTAIGTIHILRKHFYSTKHNFPSFFFV